MPPTIRPEAAADIPAIAALTRDAFADQPYSSHTEHFIIAALRDSGALSISLVAEQDGMVVGHIAFSPVRISDGASGWFGLGPIAVAPAQQRQGIGNALMQQGLTALRALPASGCVVLGDPVFYRKFGFANHPALVLADVPPAYLMALCFDGTLPSGQVRYHPAFNATR
ncbi:hypothetical protein IGB42_02968 [Andreprevotia sp. IGB-42]|uniref:GNAT family N-acetyltransferase n=1 Tax=Andreprevotia sp. IGB-42 TaxID=2497473 RepID=UPI00135B02FB|nr:N-acetyltransferase [Andreprevotia sp. IGB-42]KAF0812676.1 hypothetical protein IGB42_02968 [Andreprevotia sp. IGB-42]